MESGGVSGVRSLTSKTAPEGNVVDHGAIAQLVEHLHGMQGVRSSSLLGSILKNTVPDRVLGGRKTAFLVPFCASCPTWVVPCLPISAHDSAHRNFSAHMPQQKWFARLRWQIKDRCGLGWGIADRNGDTQLTRRINDGKQHQNPRQSVQLGVPWNPACSGDIFLKVCQLKQLVDCLLYTSPSPRDVEESRMPSSA